MFYWWFTWVTWTSSLTCCGLRARSNRHTENFTDCITHISHSRFCWVKVQRLNHGGTLPDLLLYIFSDVKVLMCCCWPRGHNFGLDRLSSTLSIWPRPGLGIVNLASKNVLSNAKQYWLYPFHGCITASFSLQCRYLLIQAVYAVNCRNTKTWLGTQMWE